MIEELKRFRFTCDACKVEVEISATSEPHAPEGWHRAEFRGYRYNCGYAPDMDLCLKCTKEML